MIYLRKQISKINISQNWIPCKSDEINDIDKYDVKVDNDMEIEQWEKKIYKWKILWRLFINDKMEVIGILINKEVKVHRKTQKKKWFLYIITNLNK